MAKTYISTLFFCCFFLLQLSVGASNPAFSTKDARPDTNTCNAPAPTNFRITAASSHFIALAWTPAWLGATQTLAVLESDGQGGWIGVDTLHNVPDSAYTVDNLTAGQTYRFYLATNCSSGDPSQLKTKIDGITLILDLTVLGRTPEWPKAPTACDAIPLNQHWRGFQVSYAEEDEYIENQFEIGFGGSSYNSGFGPTHLLVKRVGLFNPIVAAEMPSGPWPVCDDPIIHAGGSFRIVRLLNGGPDHDIAGVVNWSILNDPPRLLFCPELNHPHFPWKSSYTLTGLIARNSGSPQGCGERSWDNVEKELIFVIQNPFQDYLNVHCNRLVGQNEMVRAKLINMSGQMVLDRVFTSKGGDLSLMTSHLPTGLYFLQVELGNQRRMFKVIKSE